MNPCHYVVEASASSFANIHLEIFTQVFCYIYFIYWKKNLKELFLVDSYEYECAPKV